MRETCVAETAHAKTIVLDDPGWPGHLAGQHLDVRLTAEDGYQAQRSYSIASAPEEPLALTVERIDDGEVSPYLTEELRAGDELELRGPIGGHFTWRTTDGGPLLLLAGGSGLVPLMAMTRHRIATGDATAIRLLVSSRSADDLLYADELKAIESVGGDRRADHAHAHAARRLERIRSARRRADARRVGAGAERASARVRLRADAVRRARRRCACRARPRAERDPRRALRPERRMR